MFSKIVSRVAGMAKRSVEKMGWHYKMSTKGIRNLEKKFMYAVINSDLVTVKQCLAKGVNPNTVSPNDDNAAIHIAVERGDMSVGLALLQTPGINVNALNGDGETALSVACSQGRRKFVRLLLEKNADPNVANRVGRTPLHLSILLAFTGILSDLLRNGAIINITDVFGNTPLSFAIIENPNASITRFLLRKGADIHMKTSKYLGLLMELVLNCQTHYQIELAKILLENGADVNTTNPLTGQNSLHIVAITNYTPLAKFLLENNAKVNQRDRAGRTPMDVALEHQSREVLAVLSEWVFCENLAEPYPQQSLIFHKFT